MQTSPVTPAFRQSLPLATQNNSTRSGTVRPAAMVSGLRPILSEHLGLHGDGLVGGHDIAAGNFSAAHGASRRRGMVLR
jgi:hypothetical protein